MKKIIFRADASTRLGTGDLVSLVNLSKYFERSGWEAHFIVRNYKAAGEIIRKRAIKRFFIIEEGFGIGEEIGIINGYIADNGIDVIFLEITERPLTEYAGITGNAIQACINFDGVIHKKIDLVVNWDICAEKLYDMKKYPKTKFLLGIEYAALPVEFDFDKIGRRNYSPKARDLLITMGGADEFNFTRKIVDSIIKNKIDVKLDIVIGSGYPFKEELEKAMKSSSLDYKIEDNVTDMLSRFMSCDMAISAGGFSAFELIASRTPCLLIAVYEHQVSRCEYFDRKGWATYLGFRRFDENAMMKSVAGALRIPPALSFNTERIVSYTDGLLKGH